MLKKKHMFLVVLSFCLTIALFIGATTSQVPYDPWIDHNADGKINYEDLFALADHYGGEGPPINQAAVQFEGNISVPAAAFVPYYSTDYVRNTGWELYNYESTSTHFFAPVQLPHGAEITKVTFYWYDADTSDISCYLQNYNQGTHDTMASLYSTGSAGDGSSSDTYIFNSIVDNNQYAYFLRVVIPYSASGTDYYFEYAFIEYKY